MTARREGGIVWLEGACRVEEAELLVGFLSTGVDVVDVSRCIGLHAAVAQVLLAWRPAFRGAPDDAFLRDHLLPAIVGDGAVATIAAVGDKETDSSGSGSERTEGVQI